MNIRRIAVFHNITNVNSAWCCAEGISSVLMDQGFEVFDFKRPGANPPDLEILKAMDAIIMGGPEWFYREIRNFYGDGWRELRAVKISWYSESVYRDDTIFEVHESKGLSDLNYFPAIQDSEEFNGLYLPFGVDHKIFKPLDLQKCHGPAFIGSLYAKRREYLNRLSPQIEILPQVRGNNQMESLSALVETYNKIAIFVNLPAYSRLLTTKVTEVMACRTMLVTPRMDHPSALGNMEPFEDGKHLIYYDPDKPDELGPMLEYYMLHPDEREAIAEAGWKEVIKSHTLAQRLSKIIEDINNIIEPRKARPIQGNLL